MAAIRGSTYDHLVEQLLPVEYLGTHYITAALNAERATGNIVKITGINKVLQHVPSQKPTLINVNYHFCLFRSIFGIFVIFFIKI